MEATIQRVELYGGPADGTILELPSEQTATRIRWPGRDQKRLLVDYLLSEAMTEQKGRVIFTFVGELYE